MHYWADRINYVALKIVFELWLFKLDLKMESKLDQNQRYILVANHTSYLDIPMMFFINPGYGSFVGKSSLRKIPLFGYMYSKLYIMVNRRDPKSRNQVFELGERSLKEGKNLIIFPEGTIPNKGLPKMLPFKDGAFKIAIETNTPIVPVSILNNWKIMDDSRPMRIKKHNFAAVVHKPVETTNLGEKDVSTLRKNVYDIINESLTIHNSIESNENN